MTPQGSRAAGASLLGLIMALLSAGVASQSPTEPGGSATADAPAKPARVRTAVTRLLAQLEIVEEGPRRGYKRDEFPHWSKQDDGCTTRERVLIDEREEGELDGCTVTGGQWGSFYDDRVVEQARTLDIDHMVPLAEAWDSGASEWTRDRREAFANDLEYTDALIAVTAKSNRAKSDQDPGEWQPPAEDAWCRYATAWATQKIRWDLTADQTEVDSLRDMLMTCTAPPPTRIEVVPV